MKNKLVEELIERLEKTNAPFQAVFKDSFLGEKIKETITFTMFRIDSNNRNWGITIIRKGLDMNYKRCTKKSIIFYSYVAGCEMRLILPLELLVEITQL